MGDVEEQRRHGAIRYTIDGPDGQRQRQRQSAEGGQPRSEGRGDPWAAHGHHPGDDDESRHQQHHHDAAGDGVALARGHCTATSPIPSESVSRRLR